MERRQTSEKHFSPLERVRSFAHAGRGLSLFIRTTHNVRIHITIFLTAIIFGFFLSISLVEWMFLVLAGGFVFAAEAFNTAIEIDMNLTSPKYHPFAKDTKDMAAGAVLISAITAVVIGLFIFIPHLF